jgi:hypothetical protein
MPVEEGVLPNDEPQKLGVLVRLVVVIVAVLFAFISYVIVRGPATHIARRWGAATPYPTP